VVGHRLEPVVGGIAAGDVAGHGDHRRPAVAQCGADGGLDDRPGLGGVDEPPGVEGGDLEEEVGIDLLERPGVDLVRGRVAGDGDHRSPLLAGVHQAVDEVRRARSGRAADGHRAAREARVGDRREDARLLVADMDEVDLPVAAQGVEDGVEGIPDDPVAAPHAGCGEHVPHCIGNGLASGHRVSPPPGAEGDRAACPGPALLGRSSRRRNARSLQSWPKSHLDLDVPTLIRFADIRSRLRGSGGLTRGLSL